MGDNDHAKKLSELAQSGEARWRQTLSEADRMGLANLTNKTKAASGLISIAANAGRLGVSEDDAAGAIEHDARRANAAEALDNAKRADHRHQLESLIDQILDQKTAHIFREIVFHGHSYDDLAAELGESPSWLYRKVESAKKKLARRTEAETAQAAASAPRLELRPSPPPIVEEIGILKKIFSGESFAQRLKHWLFDAKCMAALEWRPMDLREAELSGKLIAERFNEIASAMQLGVRLSIDRTHYRIVELAPGACELTVPLMQAKLDSNDEFERWAAFVFTTYYRALSIPVIVDEERFRRESQMVVASPG